MRPLTVVETAVALSIAGSVLAIAVPAFVRNLHASRLSEPIDGLKRISARAALLADGPLKGLYPDSVGLTPEQVPQGTSVTDPPEIWEHPTWRALDFRILTPHRYSFAFESRNTKAGSTYEARAQGDLDGDGIHSTFSMSGQSLPGQRAESFPLQLDREVE